MTRAGGPTLVVDVGGTLLRRPGPGAFHRARRVLEADGPLTPERREATARAVLTGAGPEEAAAGLDEALGLGVDRRRAVADALRRPEGPAEMVPGAIELLDAARALGWRIVVATNVAAWVEPLPRAVQDRVDAVVSSAEVGLIKQDEGFWAAVVDHGVEPALALVVGDDPAADGAAPGRAGFAVLPVGPDRSTADVVDLVAAAGPVPPEVHGVLPPATVRWANREVVDAPHLAPLVASVTRRRVSLVTAAGTCSAVVVRRTGRGPVASTDEPAPDAVSYVVVTPDRRPVRAPSDLVRALGPLESVLTSLPRHEQRHLVAMVREAKDPTTRAARIDHVCGHLTAIGDDG